MLQRRAALLLIRQVTDDFTEADAVRLTDLFSLPSGRTVPLRGGLVARADGDRLTIGPADAETPFCAPLPVGEPVHTPWGTYEAHWVRAAHIPCPAHEAYVDGDRLQGGLSLRQAQAGDRFVPLGMSGSKLLSDYYTDRKMGRRARQTPLAADEAGPVFLPGGTVADRVKIQDGTKRILHIIFTKGAASYEELGC